MTGNRPPPSASSAFSAKSGPTKPGNTSSAAIIVRLTNELSHRHSVWQVFSDFCEMAAIAMRNAVDLNRREEREQRYLEIIKRYSSEELAKFPQMLAALVEALEEDPSDILGSAFHELELHNTRSGQFFTPYPVCQMIAKITLDEQDLRERIATRGFMRASEPAVGSGAMVIALSQEVRELGINYQKHLHVAAIDIDVHCVHMAYAQFALLHIPAVIVHGNALSLEEYDRWHTPAHILGFWNAKVACTAPDGLRTTIEAMPKAPEAEREEAPGHGAGPSQLTLF